MIHDGRKMSLTTTFLGEGKIFQKEIQAVAVNTNKITSNGETSLGCAIVMRNIHDVQEVLLIYAVSTF